MVGFGDPLPVVGQGHKANLGMGTSHKKKNCLVVLALTPGAGKSVGFQGAPFFTNG